MITTRLRTIGLSLETNGNTVVSFGPFVPRSRLETLVVYLQAATEPTFSQSPVLALCTSTELVDSAAKHLASRQLLQPAYKLCTEPTTNQVSFRIPLGLILDEKDKYFGISVTTEVNTRFNFFLEQCDEAGDIS